ncbi:Serine/threonine-protein kinase 3 [Dinochytrium kinnereticum]|nr:Serine/threonine-protein kinase 3 [Dinochytrium kinnereticum]
MDQMLSEKELLLDPEEVFTILGKIGEGSYGSVHKAIHTKTSTVVAIKMIPVENDLDESIKEISIMNGCESKFVVAFYGSYLKDTHLWLTFKAPEVIQEVGYGVSADIWSLGITCIEMADGRPPYHNIHPMRAIFMIPTKPPPKLENESKYSKDFKDFVARCLTKDPKERPTAEMLLQDPFVVQNRGLSVLSEVVSEALEAIAKGGLERDLDDDEDSTSSDSPDDIMSKAAMRTLKQVPASSSENDKTIKFRKSMAATAKAHSPVKSSEASSPSSISSPAQSPEKYVASDIVGSSGTVAPVDNVESEYDEASPTDDSHYSSGTMVVNSRDAGPSYKYDDTYKPDFMRQVKNEGKTNVVGSLGFDASTIRPIKSVQASSSAAATAAADAAIAAAKRKILEADQDRKAASTAMPEPSTRAYEDTSKPLQRMPDYPTPLQQAQPSSSLEDLRELLTELEANMEREIQATKLKYDIKKAPIIEAIASKGGTLPLGPKVKQWS